LHTIDLIVPNTENSEMAHTKKNRNYIRLVYEVKRNVTQYITTVNTRVSAAGVVPNTLHNSSKLPNPKEGTSSNIPKKQQCL